MKIIITTDYEKMSEKAAAIVASQIILKSDSVLGLATGSTPEGMYSKLIEENQRGYIDFSEVKSFNLDEYYGLEKENDQSYYYFMRNKLFDHVNIKAENTNIPNGITQDVERECKEYEKKILQAGGIDLQVLGIGGNGHIGFNEPNTFFQAKTHLVDLTEETIEANARFFSSKEEVPTQALTMGIQTVMQAKKIILLASGKGKADAIYKTVYGKITPQVPASILQLHNDVTLVLDEDAASRL